MKHGIYLLLITATTLVLPGGCKKDEPAAAVDLGHAYFHSTIGSWIEYRVDSMRVVGQAVSEWSYDIREVLTENFSDLEGRPAQRIIRYTRDSSGMWQPKDVWWQTRDMVRAERSEENMRRVKLVFPPRYSSFWNTNATNTSEPFELTYDEVDVPWSVNNLSFDSTVLVIGTYETNVVNSKIYMERYAKNVGMVYRQVDSSETQGTIDRWKVVYTATSFGQ